MSKIDFNAMHTTESLAFEVANVLQEAGIQDIGFKSSFSTKSHKSSRLPWPLVSELKLKHTLERDWKTKSSEFNSLPPDQKTECLKNELLSTERAYLDQKHKVSDLFFQRQQAKRAKILKDCSGNTSDAKRKFWTYISKTVQRPGDIDTVVSPDDNMQYSSPDTIIGQVENHLLKVFNGSMHPQAPVDMPVDIVALEHSYAKQPLPTTDSTDHCYAASPSPRLPASKKSSSISENPGQWLDRDFTLKEVKYAVKKLKNGKAIGLDGLPNEFIINAGEKFWSVLVVLFNKIKDVGTLPSWWNEGRVTLVHKSGPREILGNYRPLTVINSISGLFSRVLNERLTAVVEKHSLLGEIQNGFRKNRSAADNSFLLNTLLWKNKHLRRKVHMAFVDLTKAYDCVDRSILWSKLSKMGFGGKFLATLKAIYRDDSIKAVVNGVASRAIYFGRGLHQGCSLSPVLFALYMAEMGEAINLSGEGFMVGNVCLSGLFFADDIGLFGRTPEGLKRLLLLVKKHADLIRIEINTKKDKSEVVSQSGSVGDVWEVSDASGQVVLSLNQVLNYRYLGSPVFSTIFKTCVEKQNECVSKAHKYKGTCMYLSSQGPDIVDMILATWKNVAVPSILFGTEAVPFSDANILEIERAQNQVAKYALGVPICTAGICAQFELGLKTFRHLLYEHQLKFYQRLLKLDENRWAKQALRDHSSLLWPSPYIDYIHKIRVELKLFEFPMKTSKLVACINTHFIQVANDALAAMALPWLKPMKYFRRQIYVKEGAASSALSQFRYDVANMGRKYPRIGRTVITKYCPLCPINVKNSVPHLVMFCSSVEDYRKKCTGISAFRNMCILKGFSEENTFAFYINGMDWNELYVDGEQYLERGTELKSLLDYWLSKW